MPRTKKTDQEKSAGKNAKNAAKKQEAAGQAQEATQEPEAAGQAQEATQEPETAGQAQETTQEPEAAGQDQEAAQEPEEAGQDQEPDLFASLPNPCVYCGPSVKGVARQYTTYQGGIPDALREFIKKHPPALGLIVPTGAFPTMRRRLETHGTKEAELYKAVKAEL